MNCVLPLYNPWLAGRSQPTTYSPTSLSDLKAGVCGGRGVSKPEPRRYGWLCMTCVCVSTEAYIACSLPTSAIFFDCMCCSRWSIRLSTDCKYSTFIRTFSDHCASISITWEWIIHRAFECSVTPFSCLSFHLYVKTCRLCVCVSVCVCVCVCECV